MFSNSSIRVGIAVLSVSFVCGATSAQDSLFSGGSLVERTEKPPELGPPPGVPGGFESPDESFDEASIDERLRAAGFATKVVDGKRVIEITVGSAKADLQVEIVEDRLSFVLPLGPIDADRLRDVLQANARIAPATFVLNPAEQRLEMRLSLRSTGLAKDVLSAEIDRFAKGVTETAPVWKPAPPASAKAPATPPAEQQPAAPKKRTLNLVGRWVVELPQGGGFVLKLEKDRTFVLGHAKPGAEVDRSEGTFDLEQGQLVLVHADGSKLAGKIVGLDENSFRYSIGSGDGLVFERK